MIVDYLLEWDARSEKFGVIPLVFLFLFVPSLLVGVSAVWWFKVLLGFVLIVFAVWVGGEQD